MDLLKIAFPDPASANVSVPGCSVERQKRQDRLSESPEGQPIAENANPDGVVRVSQDTGMEFNDLVDRLLSQPMSKSDSKFSAMFLCLYRKFSTPARLLNAIIARFEDLHEYEDSSMMRVSSQLRYLSLMAHWVATYPGDFAHPLTYSRMTEFITGLASNRIFALAAREMACHLEVVSEDDDTYWACSDPCYGEKSFAEPETGSLTNEARTSASDVNKSVDEADTSDGYINGEKSSQTASQSAGHSATSSASSIVNKLERNSSGSVQIVLNSLESAQMQARLLVPVPRTALTKIQWHQFMDASDEDIARELTRIDWIMFSAIRPRDLVRHVSSSADRKSKCQSLEHIDRMIGQFNHVAYWVTNVILLREKPKHRAKALEKFMGLAWVSAKSIRVIDFGTHGNVEIALP